MTHPTDKSEVAAAYNRWAETYDTDANRTRDMAAAVLKRSDLKITGRDVIEVGCGTGRNTVWMAERAANVIALDFSEGMLRQARERVPSPLVRFLRHDVRSAWPVADASADLIIIMLVLEHVESLGPIFAESARVLRGGGELFVCELHPTRQMHGRQAEFIDRQTGERERVTAFLHDVSEYVNTGLQSGFELVRLGEWRDSPESRGDLPRVLSLQFRLRLRPGD